MKFVLDSLKVARGLPHLADRGEVTFIHDVAGLGRLDLTVARGAEARLAGQLEFAARVARVRACGCQLVIRKSLSSI